MDEKDRQILDILKEDGRASYTEVADQVNVSEGTVRNRVQDMIESGVIEKFTVKTAEHGAKAVVMAQVSTDADIDQVIQGFPAGMSINEVTGDYDLIIEFNRDSTEQLNDTLDEIRSVEGVEQTKTYTVLKTRNL